MPGPISRTTKESIRDALKRGVSIDDAAAFFGVDPRTVISLMVGESQRVKGQTTEDREEGKDA